MWQMLLWQMLSCRTKGEEDEKINVNEAKDNKERIAPVIQSDFVGHSSELLTGV